MKLPAVFNKVSTNTVFIVFKKFCDLRQKNAFFFVGAGNFKSVFKGHFNNVFVAELSNVFEVSWSEWRNQLVSGKLQMGDKGLILDFLDLRSRKSSTLPRSKLSSNFVKIFRRAVFLHLVHLSIPRVGNNVGIATCQWKRRFK